MQDWEKQRKEFEHDLLEKVDHGIVSSDGCTRFNTKREAQLALDKVLENWNSRNCNDIYSKASYWQVPFERRERFKVEYDAKKYANQCQGLDNHIEESQILDQTLNEFRNNFAERNSENLQTGKMTMQEYSRQFAKEWNALRNKKRLKREERKQYDKDVEMARTNSPLRKFERDVIGKINCECKLDEVRLTGKICKACELILDVQKYTLNRYKDAAQGRMPSSGFMPRS